MQFTKQERDTISRAGLAWTEAMTSLFKAIAIPGVRGRERAAKARQKAAEALSKYRCVLGTAKSSAASRASQRAQDGAQ